MPALLQRPEQGWSSLLLLLGMLVVVGLTVAETAPLVLGETDRSDTMVATMLAAGLIGFLLARSHLGVVRAHFIGATAAAVVLLLVAGAALAGATTLLPLEWAEVGERLSLLRVEVQADLARAEQGVGSTTAVTFLVLGAICWTTAQFSAFSIFRYDRGGPAVMASGIVLLLYSGLAAFDTSVEVMSVLPRLAIFSTLAMLLLMRLQLTQQSYQWARRHISDTGEVGRLFLRSGTLFVLLSVVGASTLTFAATTGPHEPPIDEINDALDDLGDELSRWLPVFGIPREPDALRSIEDRFDIKNGWDEIGGTAFTATITAGDLGGNYWWMSAHDTFDGVGWDWDDSREIRVEEGELPSTSDPRSGPFVTVEATIEIDDPPSPLTVISPAEASRVWAPVVLSVVDQEGSVGRINFQEDDVRTEVYEVEASARAYDGSAVSLTAETLRAAGNAYPRWVKARYLGGTEGPASGRLTRAKAREIGDDNDNAYDKALALQDELSGWEYDTEAFDCGGLNVPECLLTHKQGYCQTYATTMAMVLREMGIPSRFVRGFLPGEPQDDGSWQVENAAYHAWVEVYFPGYGWIRFDPTPGEVQSRYGLERTKLPPGESGGGRTRDESPLPTRDPGNTFPIEEPTPSPDPVTELGGGGGEGDDALVALIIGGGIAGMLLLVAVGLLFMRLRRLPGGDGGLAYRRHRQPGCAPGPRTAPGADRVRVRGQPVRDDPVGARGPLRRGRRTGGVDLRPAGDHGRAACSLAPGLREAPTPASATVVVRLGR